MHLYQNFGPAASILQPLALLASVVVAVLVRRRQIPIWTSVLAAACVVGMMIAFAVGNAPINHEQAGWITLSLPADWAQVRDAWEHFHAAPFGLAALEFAALLVGTLYDGMSASRT